MNRHLISAVLLVAAAGFGGCTKPTPSVDAAAPADSQGASQKGVTSPQQSEWAAIEQLEAQAKTIARVDGCSASSECRTAEVGSRACGGPRYHVPWCAKTTDSAALYSKLAEVAKAEQDYNAKHQLASTCELRMPPAIELSGASCVVVQAR